MYSIAVKIDDIEKRRRSNGFLHIVVGFFIILKTAEEVRNNGYPNYVVTLPLLALASAALFYGFFRKKIDITATYNGRMRILESVALVSLAFLFFREGNSVNGWLLLFVAGAAALIYFTERQLFSPVYILLEDKGISVPGAYATHLIPWEALEQVVVREDFLTIFHKKQKYLQYQVRDDLTALEVSKMNAYCGDMIRSATTVTQ